MEWPGFSPGPVSINMSPGHQSFEFSNLRRGVGEQDQPESPLVFMRTPGAAGKDDTCPDSSKRFNSWMENTSPYTARQTPPTASMKSLAAGDENTPPGHDMARELSEKGGSFGSQHHFQSWLRATSSTSWTPRKSPAAGTPPPAPAPSPAGTPMSIMRDLQHSAATPPTAHHLQPPGAQHVRVPGAAGDGFDTSEDEDDAGEASTTVGAAQIAAAADRAAAASRMAGQRLQADGSCLFQQQQRQLSTPPRVPAPSPLVNSPMPLGLQQQQASLLQAAADRMAQDSLATPMSQLSISRRAGGEHNNAALNPGRLLDRSAIQAAPGPPASPAEKLIGLMMSPGADGHRRQHHHHQQQQPGQQLTPSRLLASLAAAPSAQAPVSPSMQVIDLMMHPSAAAVLGPESSACASWRAAQQDATAADEQEGDVGDGSSRGLGSEYDSESDDEMDLSELQALVGEGVGPDTPLSVILGMLTGTPEVCGLTPQFGAPEQQQAGNDDIGPRVLFADD